MGLRQVILNLFTPTIVSCAPQERTATRRAPLHATTAPRAQILRGEARCPQTVPLAPPGTTRIQPQTGKRAASPVGANSLSLRGAPPAMQAHMRRVRERPPAPIVRREHTRTTLGRQPVRSAEAPSAPSPKVSAPVIAIYAAQATKASAC